MMNGVKKEGDAKLMRSPALPDHKIKLNEGAISAEPKAASLNGISGVPTNGVKREVSGMRDGSGGATNGDMDLLSPLKSETVISGNGTAPVATARRKIQPQQQQQQLMQHPDFGGHVDVATTGDFPSPGSTLGQYFCLGRIGKGTFCSIHKCINMHYFHRSKPLNSTKGSLVATVKEDSSTTNAKVEENGKAANGHSPAGAAATPNDSQDKPQCRVVAAKIEVGEFQNSGVLGGEATILQFLDSSLPRETVPLYMGHYRGDKDMSAIVMEFLPGQDMHQIRDWATGQLSRRIALQDAVYLTADVMLPLLQRMHEVGIVHRDVKPSNCVKRGGLKDFAMVDFGLSKSIVVPSDSPLSDTEHPWNGIDWIRPPNFTGTGHYRQERETADFRGTSMYASVRVHQLKDYCPRDDCWSLMYVFCDLATGGLPWMSHAANRDRQGCQKLKERIHGEEPGVKEQTRQLLLGHEYHVAMFRNYGGEIDPPEGQIERDLTTLPPPLEMSKSEKKLQLLKDAFVHLGKLKFCDMPDYDLLRRCIRGFLDEPIEDESVPPIQWEKLMKTEHTRQSSSPLTDESVPSWNFEDIADDMELDTFIKAEEAKEAETSETLTGDAADLARLPLEFQYRIAQMEYNILHDSTISPHIALQDWMAVALPLLHGPWDSKLYERGGHRSDADNYRRQLFLKIIEKCILCARKFKMFRSPDCYYDVNENRGESGSTRLSKRRKITCSMGNKSAELEQDLLAVSKVFFHLQDAKAAEEKKTYAPPPLLSFG